MVPAFYVITTSLKIALSRGTPLQWIAAPCPQHSGITLSLWISPRFIWEPRYRSKLTYDSPWIFSDPPARPGRLGPPARPALWRPPARPARQ
eukprot:1094359-Pyramimonas_sp.AAC.1